MQRHPAEKDEGDHGRGSGLGQVARVVGVQRAQSPGCRHGQLARALISEPRGTASESTVQQLSAEGGDDAVGGPQGGQLADAVHHRAGHDRHSDQHDGRCHGSEGHVVEQRPIDHVRQRHRLHDDEGRAEGRDGQGDAGGRPQAGHPRREDGVDEAGTVRSGGGGAHGRCENLRRPRPGWAIVAQTYEPAPSAADAPRRIICGETALRECSRWAALGRRSARHG